MACPAGLIPIRTANGSTVCHAPDLSGGGLIPVASDYWNKLFFGAQGADASTLILGGLLVGLFWNLFIRPSKQSKGERRVTSARRGRRYRTKRARPRFSSEREELQHLLKTGAKVSVKK